MQDVETRIAPGSNVQKTFRTALLASALYFAIIPYGTVDAVAQNSQSYSFSIPAQPLAQALVQFSTVTGVDVVFDGALPSGMSSNGLRGSYSAAGGLGQLLNGTNLTYRFSGPSTVVIVDPKRPSVAAGGAIGGETTLLDTITVTGKGGGPDGGFTSDTPYETPGGVGYISREQIERLPPTSPGDMLSGVPGVLNGGTRVGNSINPNIRGLQGMGRVNTSVDGAVNSTTSYRGYAGNRDETYVDPDMIGGIDITKGPGDGVGGGAIGGNIAMRTLIAEDIVKPGENWSVRIKSGLGSNTVTPPYKEFATDPKIYRAETSPTFFNGDSWSGSIAAATLQDNFEGVVAYTKRKQGNYFAGKNNAADGFIYGERDFMVPGKNATVKPGDEVYNTSEDTESFLVKNKLKWGDGQSFELGFMRYDSISGEEDEALFNGTGSYGTGQLSLSRTKLDSYTARYRNAPSDNDLINLRANLWHTDLEHERGQAYPVGIRDHNMATTGGDISNTAKIDTGLGQVTVDGGIEFRYERAKAPIQYSDLTSRGPNGERMLTSGFAKASIDPTEWLTLSAGVRFDHFDANGNEIAALYPDRTDSRLSPNFGIVVKPLEGIQLFAQYKEGFRAPSLRELYWELYSLKVNPDLQGEVSKNWEFGLNVLREDVLTAGDKIGFKASYFRNHYENYIVTEDVPGSFGASQHYANIDRANYNGIELSGTYDTGIFFLEGAFTKYLKAEYCSEERGCYLPRLDETLANLTPPTYVPPEWNGSVTAGTRLFDENLTLGGRASFSSTRIGSSWPPAPTPLGGLIGLNYTWPEFVVFDLFGIRNINTLWPLLANTPLPLARLHSAFAREEAGGTYHNYAAASDITRLLILYLYGGVYLDMDVSFKQNSSNLFDILTNIGQQLGVLRFSMKNYGNGVLASMPRTDAVSMCLNKISELYTSSASSTFSWGLKRGYGDYRMKLTVMLTGPQLIIDTLLAKGLLLPIDQSQHFQPIDVSGSSYKNYPGRQRHDSSP